MMMPNCHKAEVPQRKINDYLLSEIHPVGKSKARYFKALGFSEERTEEMKNGILNIAQQNNISEKIKTEFGIKYIVRGTLNCPNGEKVELITVWIIESVIEAPRLITVYPA
jgi:hypothetical protein